MKNSSRPPIHMTRRPVFVGLGAWMMSNTTGANTPEPQQSPLIENTPYRGKAPFSAKEFWERMLALIEDTKQPPSKEKVEETLGMKFGRSTISAPFSAHFADPGCHWYFGAKLTTGARRPDIQIWTDGHRPMQFADGQLRWDPTVLQSLLTNGWTKSRSLPHFYQGMHLHEKLAVLATIHEIKNEIHGISFDWLL